ncbi:MAG: type I-E CRISPR-associated protein Cse1/CasA, partial [Deltaproteobacteria bacterium]|nr:type I-E CRISPR-associated protein Cse1/CasA [Deltaproteobacteria bacterium]
MNLLTDPLLRVQTAASEVRQMSLPELFSALGRDEVESLPGLQRHQADALHVFLCYLAGAILARSGDTEPVQETSYWERGLVDLSEGQENWAWRLVVEDVSKPAFFQAPLPAADRLSLKAVTPDRLDLLPTAKNHDVKKARGFYPHPDEWVYTLVSLQT